MSDRFFTLMIVPERSDKIRKFTLPAWYLRAGLVLTALMLLVGLFIFFDYLHVMSQVAENKSLRVENQRLQSEIQSAKTKLESLDQSVGRLKSFAHKLRVISNLDNPGSQKILQSPSGPVNSPKGSVDEGEDSGVIREPGEPQAEYIPDKEDIHARLEQQRTQTVMGELGQSFYTESLIEQVSQINHATVQLNQMTREEEKNFADLQEHLQDRVARLLSTPSTMPAQGYISSEFGYRHNPFSGVRTFHAGIDLANNYGTLIYAPADGLVTLAGNLGGFGLVVRIDHGYNVVTKYGHNSKVLVKPGQRVRRGDRIAAMGSSGRSTGPHLHYQVEVTGRPVNPRLFILEDTF